MQRHSIFLQQPILPPYRLSFVKQLAKSPLLSTTVAYGQEHPRSALRSILNPDGVSVRTLRNVFVASDRLMTAQMGAVTAFDISHFDTLICTFDPRIVTNTLLVLKAKRHHVPVILWGHGIRPRGRFKHLYKRAAEIAEAVILYSAKGKRELQDLGVPEGKMFVAWNSIDTHVIAGVRDGKPLRERDGIIYVGRLVRDKKILLLIKGFARARGSLPAAAHLYIVGSGPMRVPAEKLARDLGIAAHVTFAGETYREEEVASWMNRSWISVSPGYIGLSVIHAFAYGLPMIAGDREPHSPEVEALLPGKNGEFFTADDPEALARSLVSIHADPARLTAMGQAALVTSDFFSVRSMVAAFERAVAFAHGEGPPDLGTYGLDIGHGALHGAALP
ncbi:MAG TPA: glycosyltransferase family 4 protein [Polyangia bacterium]|nr:glycosyltransferase family 4 protein [Polyangia bacterium]